MRRTLKVAIAVDGRTQRELSFDARISESRLSAIVRGRVAPTLAEQIALARELRRPANELFAEGSS